VSAPETQTREFLQFPIEKAVDEYNAERRNVRQWRRRDRDRG